MIKPFTYCLFLCASCLSIIAWQTPLGGDWKAKVSAPLLDKAMSQGEAEFIIRLNQQADLSDAKLLKTKEEKARFVYNRLQQTAQASQAGLKNLLDKQGVQYHAYFVVNALFAKGDYNLIKQLAERPEVASIEDNPHIKLELPEQAPVQADLRGPSAIEWGISMIRADSVWSLGYTGQGVVVAGQDTGYDWTHPSLQSKYRGMITDSTADHNYHWHDAIRDISLLHEDSIVLPELNPCGLDVKVPCDDNNHGTHTMGTMVGEDGENQIGVAPGAKWIACRNMERGYGSPASYIECYEFFMAPTDLNGENPKPEMAPHVINNSWSCPEKEGCNISNWATMEMVVNNLRTSGVVVVVSAGNSGSKCSSVNAPSAMFENSFSIGATASNDTIARFSSRGPVMVDSSGRMKPNVSAPGVRVRSAVRNGGYRSFSGTSMAGPHVAGAVALIISANPDLAGQVEIIEDILEKTAVAKTTDELCGDTPGSEVPNNTYGFGRIDALAAVELAKVTVSTQTPLDATQITAYPNPTEQSLNFRIVNKIGKVNMNLFAVDGSKVMNRQWTLSGYDDFSMDVSKLPPGLYFYQLQEGEKVWSGKIVKK